ncbi:hypothetical protein F892_00016 [Acinetobacter vivianii]|uniref:DUF7673 domain-containing protein n=1 Tax=Acinetobacter vivianii TaxID=1776742 RepID=N9Q4H9_9GAMM|nr:hypothetical protein [Acinetobacter vivianii]ENX24866.1 hypothetical protein F892_00016 [Acinetobacter vivianii]GGI62127.1 hypothetical protein GCM10011446_36220 [Acinetobacter vivianii]
MQQPEQQEMKNKLMQGIKAIEQLFAIAEGKTEQSFVVRKFLLGCFDSQKFKFDLTEFRKLDSSVFQACVSVLEIERLESNLVDEYLDSPEYQALAKKWELLESWAEVLEFKKEARTVRFS